MNAYVYVGITNSTKACIVQKKRYRNFKVMMNLKQSVMFFVVDVNCIFQHTSIPVLMLFSAKGQMPM